MWQPGNLKIQCRSNWVTNFRFHYLWQPGNLKIQCRSNWVTNFRFHEYVYLYWVYFPSLPGLVIREPWGWATLRSTSKKGVPGSTRSSAAPGAIPSATDEEVRWSTWQGLHMSGAQASGLEAPAFTLTQTDLWRHKDVNPCSVPGQTRGITPGSSTSPFISGLSTK